jgi:heme-degrading monooxygenase HmoA
MTLLALDVQAPTQPAPIDPHYMLLPIDQGFDWDTSFQGIETGAWYLVVFRSKHRPGADEALLTALDNGASESARDLPGFLHYFIGTPLHSGECLSFCLWNSREEAAFASAQPAHREAVMKGIAHYEYYALERYTVVKDEGIVSFARL